MLPVEEVPFNPSHLDLSSSAGEARTLLGVFAAVLKVSHFAYSGILRVWLLCLVPPCCVCTRLRFSSLIGPLHCSFRR